MKILYLSSLWIYVVIGAPSIVLLILFRKKRPDIKFFIPYILLITTLAFLRAMIKTFDIWENLKGFVSVALGLMPSFINLGIALSLVYPVKKGTCQLWVLIFVICMTIISVVHYFLNGRPYEFYTP